MFITLHAGDLLLQAVNVHSLDKDDPMPVHYFLFFRDLPTGQTAELSCENEVEQAYMVAAWIISDETPDRLGVLLPYLQKLKEKLPKKSNGHEIFLP